MSHFNDEKYRYNEYRLYLHTQQPDCSQGRVDEWVQEHFKMFPNHVYCMECQEFYQTFQQHSGLGASHLKALTYAEYQFKIPQLIRKQVMARLKGE